MGLNSKERKRQQWREWQARERELERQAQRERRAHSERRQRDRDEKIIAFGRRLVAMQDVCDHLGVSVRTLNHGLHIQFVCDGIVGNFYPTTNRLFVQRPVLGKTLGSVKHRDALLAYFTAVRDVLEIPELYVAAWEFDDSGLPPAHVRSATTDICGQLREAVLRVAARQPTLLQGVSPREFEFLVAELLKDEGYETTVTQATRDGGRDIVAMRRRGWEGEYVLLVECKRFVEKPVDIGVIQRIVGVRYINQADSAMVVTTSRFTGSALEEAQRVREELSLVDQHSLQEWLLQYDARRTHGEASCSELRVQSSSFSTD